jgi:hypothetical protein
MIHKRRFLFSEDFSNAAELAVRLQTIDLYARVNDHLSPSVEMQMDGTAIRADVWEETLSDGSTQLVVQLC